MTLPNLSKSNFRLLIIIFMASLHFCFSVSSDASNINNCVGGNSNSMPVIFGAFSGCNALT